MTENPMVAENTVSEKVVITGGFGCIGAWVATLLVADGASVTIADLSTDDHRLRLVADQATRSKISTIQADLTNADQVTAALAGATHVIHLGALQVPFCRADPRAGAAVNVGGTINVFEAALTHGIEHVTYASSVAVYGPMADPAEFITDATPFDPRTLYGGYKVANEHAARVYDAEAGLPTIGLRPHTLYGPGRDQGLTSQPTQAIGAALAGQPFHIEYGGSMGFQYAPDVARWFIAAMRAKPEGALVYNVGGTTASVAEFVAEIETAVPGSAGLVTHGNEPLDFPRGADDSALRARLGEVDEATLADGVSETARILGAAADR